ncbi:hypothetical protein [Polaromonas hydrogenivorans]|uniref:Uncharacterized protein n=1 Tax=Polaromonas hydrogenivorans TaxID=335476 RepID=A0AAU7LTF5_9BURK
MASAVVLKDGTLNNPCLVAEKMIYRQGLAGFVPCFFDGFLPIYADYLTALLRFKLLAC